MDKGMTAEDIKFTHGKGNICNLCGYSSVCHRINRIKNYAESDEGIYNISIQIFACDRFKRKEEL